MLSNGSRPWPAKSANLVAVFSLGWSRVSDAQKIETPTLPAWNQAHQLNASVRMAKGFAGASRTEWSSQWQTSLSDGDDALTPDLRTLWERSQDLHRNSSIITGATETLVRGVVGRGIQCIPRADVGNEELNQALRQKLSKAWTEFCKTAGADGTSTFADKCRQSVYLMARDGDCLAVWPSLGDGPVPLQVDLITASRVESPSGDTAVRLGVIYKGRKADGYTVRKSASKIDAKYYRWSRKKMGAWSSNLLIRPFCQVPGQSRGFPIIASAIKTIKDFETYLQAEVRRAITNSKVAGIITAPDPTVLEKAFSNINTGRDGAAYQNSYMGRTFGSLFDAQIMSLATGESMEMFNPNNTNVGLQQFIESLLRVIANAYGLPHSIAFSLYSDINFSNARTQILQARRTFDVWRETLVRGLCEPTYEMFVRYLWSEGMLPEVREVTPEILTCEWRADIEPWVDPLKEVKANSEAIANLLASHESVAAERGEDARAIATQEMEFAAWKKAEMKRLGLEATDLGYVPTETMSRNENEAVADGE